MTRPDQPPPVDVLVVGCQGVYKDGRFHSEYHDRGLYLEHGMSVARIAREGNYRLVVVSGGHTQAACRHLCESRSMTALWEDTGTVPEVAVYYEERALDTVDNLALSLMEARLALGAQARIRRIGVLLAWAFKTPRVVNYAITLGIHESTYVHAISRPGEVTVWSSPTGHGMGPQTRGEFDNDLDHILLLRGDAWERKRMERWGGMLTEWSEAQHTAYAERLQPLRGLFPGTFAALDHLTDLTRLPAPQGSSIRAALEAAGEFDALRTAFQREVINPATAP